MSIRPPVVPPLWSADKKPGFIKVTARSGVRTERPVAPSLGGARPVQVETARPAHRRDESGKMVLPSVPRLRPLSRQLNYHIPTPDIVHRGRVDLGIPQTPRSSLSAFSARQNDYMVSLTRSVDQARSHTARNTHRSVGTSPRLQSQRETQQCKKQFEASMTQLQELIDSVSSDKRRKAMQVEMDELKQLALDAEAPPQQFSDWTPSGEDSHSNMLPPGLFGVGVDPMSGVEDEDGTKRFERRSNRRIVEDVQLRLDILFADQQKQTDFQKYLAELKPNTANDTKRSIKGRKIMAENKQMPKLYYPDASRRRLKHAKLQREERRQQVLERAQQAAEERAQRTLASAHRREIRLRQAAESAAKQASLAQLQQLQKRWSVFVALGARQRVFCKAIERQRALRALNALQTPAARSIQIWYRRIFYDRVEKEQTRAKVIVERALRRMMRRWHAWNQIRSANMIRDFFTEVKEVTKISKVVKKYRLCVIQLQRFIRGYMPVWSMQLERLRDHWLLIEVPLLEEKNRKLKKRHEKDLLRQKALRNKLVSTAVARREKERKDKGFKMRDLGDTFATIIPSVPDELRMPILIKDLKRRKLMFLEEIRSHKAEVEKWEQDKEIDVARAILDAAEDDEQDNASDHDDGPPKRPLFEWRVADDYMRRLVEQGIRDLLGTMEETVQDV